MTTDATRKADDLLRGLGYESWRAGQREAVVAALEGRDSLIVMPTGGGKSLCYQLPGLATEDLTIVVSPLIALMRDQWQKLTAQGRAVAMISSGMGDEEVREAMAQVRGEARIVYCAPERFASNFFLEALSHRTIDLVAVDEAHCVSEWGHDFRPDYLRLPQVVERLGRPTVMACTATATRPVAAEIASRFGMRDPLQVRSGFDRPNLSFDVVALEGKGSKARRQALLEAGLADPANRPGIVYCGTRRDTDEVAAALRQGGAAALPYHAGMEAEERTAVQGRFMSGEVDVIVATNAFGMGVDKADVRSVWHMAIPTSVEAYYQEAGRAGRDGLPARAVLLAMKADLGRLVRFNQQRAGDPELAIAHERGWRAYHAIKSFIYSERCRRRSLLDHFSDRTAGAPLERCCDVCDSRDWLPDPETIAIRPSKSAAGKAPAPDLSPADESLFEALKAWRLRAAAGKPAFTVASNRTLTAIAAARPTDADALIAISGVGPSFISKYAPEVLALVAEHPASLTEAA
ncbi:MAG TPA: ATP-dependent DNA helicase RecQ [Solirubrobacterales bacterium]|jgi:RecQ family ATP-dependent DNA helicase|nr:ATP-dependent DNA helicase RecQ [Solirubrobacterales bacterium]